jgi:ATP-dependent DNA helicase RecG
VGDLLLTLPRRYDDERSLCPIGELVVGERQVTAGVVASVKSTGYRAKRRLEVVLEPLPEHPGGRHGLLRLVWFRAYDLEKRFSRGARFRVAGRVDEYRGQLQMAHPDFARLAGDDEGEGGGVVPRYPEVGGVPPVALQRAVSAAIDRGLSAVADAVPAVLREREELPTMREALLSLHRPGGQISDEELDALNRGTTKAHARLAFEEFFLLELALHRRRAEEDRVHAEALSPPGAPLARAREALPFALTGAQERVVGEIGADLKRDQPMRRLLQGDVGAGKTAVAMLAAAHAVAAGAQVAFMAPTEILAEQHLASFQEVGRALGLRLSLVVGGARAAHRRKVRSGLASGTIDVAVGTHALLTEGVEFNRLRLVIVDEQHRFGVGQRLRLVQKNEGEQISPHLLVMTATPIPRSLALALYGDLDASVLDELPPGRVPPVTRAYPLDKRESALRQLSRALEKGGQAYLICPLVEESEEMDLRDAESTFEEMKKRFGAEQVALVHGRMGSDDRREAMDRFARGDARILVSTTVVEVGVDVPQANVVLIEHAERFGLAQLHQLRGRVGRRGQKSACLLVHDATTDEAKARVRVMCETSDGFRIAEEDLAIRGPGELFGRRQSGLPGFRFGDLRRDLALLGRARDAARAILEADPDLEDDAHREARRALERLAAEVVREEAG